MTGLRVDSVVVATRGVVSDLDGDPKLTAFNSIRWSVLDGLVFWVDEKQEHNPILKQRFKNFKASLCILGQSFTRYCSIKLWARTIPSFIDHLQGPVWPRQSVFFAVRVVFFFVSTGRTSKQRCLERNGTITYPGHKNTSAPTVYRDTPGHYASQLMFLPVEKQRSSDTFIQRASMTCSLLFSCRTSLILVSISKKKMELIENDEHNHYSTFSVKWLVITNHLLTFDLADCTTGVSSFLQYCTHSPPKPPPPPSGPGVTQQI